MQDETSYMGRIRLRAAWQQQLTDADSRSENTVVDEQYKRYDIIKPTDPCPS